MIAIFNTGIQHYFIYVALLAMASMTIEFYLSRAYEHDRILFMSNLITTICIGLYIFGNGDIAVVFVVFSYVFLNVYSQFFRRR